MFSVSSIVSNNEEKLNKKKQRSLILIKKLNDKIKISSNSLNKLKKITNISPCYFLFGGITRNACYIAMNEEKKLNEIKSIPESDTDIVTVASSSQIKSEFPKIVESKKAERLFSSKGAYYSDDVSIRQIPDLPYLLDKNNYANYFDCTINSILYNKESGLIDITGHALPDLEDGVIEDFNPEDKLRVPCLIRELRFEIRFGFKFSESTQKGIVKHLPNNLNTQQFANRGNKELLKLFMEGETSKMISRLMADLSDNIKIKIIDLLLPSEIADAIKEAYNTSNGYNKILEVIEMQKLAGKNASIAPIYKLFIDFAIDQQKLNDSSDRRIMYNKIVSSNPLFKAILPVIMQFEFKLEFSLFKKMENQYLENNRHTDSKIQHEYDKRFAVTSLR